MSVSVCPECLSHGVPLKCVYLETPGEQIPSQSNALGHRRPRVQPQPRVTSPAVYRPIVDPRRPLSPEPDPRIFSSTSTPRLLNATNCAHITRQQFATITDRHVLLSKYYYYYYCIDGSSSIMEYTNPDL